MFLTATNLFSYLDDIGLSSCVDIVGEDFRLVEVGRRNRNFLLMRTQEPSLFLKQVPIFHPETITSFFREAACMRLARDAGRKPVLHALCPRLRLHDETRHVLIYDMFADSEVLSLTIAREPASLAPIMHQLGLTLAAMHMETSADGGLAEIGSVLGGTPPWVLGIGTNAENVMPNMSPAQRQIVDQIRLSKPLSQGLDALNATWRHRCLVHGDLKWDNLMLLKVAGRRELRFIDWELADIGEPLWDLAQVIGSILQYWLLNVPADAAQNHSSGPITQGSIQLAALARLFRNLWANYIEQTRQLHPDSHAAMELTSKLVGARLVLLAFELHPRGDVLLGYGRLALRIAEYFFVDPLGAARDLLGLISVQNSGEVAHEQPSKPVDAPWEVCA